MRRNHVPKIHYIFGLNYLGNSVRKPLINIRFNQREKKEMAKKKSAESVNHPQHYGGDTEYECIKVLKAWLSESEFKGFLKGNAIKYLCRCGKKDEEKKELKKAKWYIEKMLEGFDGNNNGR